MGGMHAKIILDSVGPNGARLTTFELRYPRFIHAELMTHRMLTKSSASSRAIPSKKLLEQIRVDPAMPVHWGANQSGMQASAELEGEARSHAEATWLRGRDWAAQTVESLLECGLHKQIANRPLEPWMFITVAVTATELDNAWGLRIDPHAQPEFCALMTEARAAYFTSDPQLLHEGEWHLPYVTGNDADRLVSEGKGPMTLARISAARIARMSYLTHDGIRDPKADVALADRLQDNGHMAPFEHPAKALTPDQWDAIGTAAALAWARARVPAGNLWGWHQLRKMMPDEHNFSIIKARRIV